MGDPSLSDVLSAAGLVLAVLAILFGVWSGEISAALKIEAKDFRSDRAAQVAEARAAFYGKSLWLAVGATAAFLVFAPRAIALAGDAIQCDPATCRYDDVPAAFLLAVVFILLIAGVTLVQAWRLRAKLAELAGPDR